jgi:hypothetical protein
MLCNPVFAKNRCLRRHNCAGYGQHIHSAFNFGIRPVYFSINLRKKIDSKLKPHLRLITKKF